MNVVEVLLYKIRQNSRIPEIQNGTFLVGSNIALRLQKLKMERYYYYVISRNTFLSVQLYS